MNKKEVNLKSTSVNIKWSDDNPKLRHYIVDGSDRAQSVISWVYNTSCSTPQLIINDCKSVLDKINLLKETGLNSSHGSLYSYNQLFNLDNLAEIRDEWDFNDCVFLPIEELIKVIEHFHRLFVDQRSGVINFSLYDLEPSYRSDAEHFDENGNVVF